MRRILGLGTYPIKQRMHGGQRRIAAFQEYYASIGIEYQYACIYDGNYGGETIDRGDVPLTYRRSENLGIPFIDDLNSGFQAADDEVTFRHFSRLIEAFSADAIQLEQTFMWPFIERFRREVRPSITVIYSSQNVEGPLKAELLRKSGVPLPTCRRIADIIDRFSVEAARGADLTIAVSTHDAAYYKKISGGARQVLVVSNGVSRPPPSIPSTQAADVFGGNPFLLFVGSPYPPNIWGFCRLVARDGLFFCPPRYSIAVCGGVSDGIYQDREFLRFAHANNARVHFFPKIDDLTLSALKHACHGVLLPIQTGGGSNLKTAEALVLGKWVISTSVAMRGFEQFSRTEGVIIADEQSFRRAASQVLREPQLWLPENDRKAREALYWDRCFADSGLESVLAGLTASKGAA